MSQLEDICSEECLLDAVGSQHLLLFHCGKLIDVNETKTLGPFVGVLQRLTVEETSSLQHKVSKQDQIHFLGNHRGQHFFVFYEGSKVLIINYLCVCKILTCVELVLFN